MLLRPHLLHCESPECFAIYGVEHIDERLDIPGLRYKACEDGWFLLRYPGAPWRAWDLCPLHKDLTIHDLQGGTPMTGLYILTDGEDNRRSTEKMAAIRARVYANARRGWEPIRTNEGNLLTENQQLRSKPKRRVIVVQDVSGSIEFNGILADVQGGLETLFKDLRADEEYDTSVWLYAFSNVTTAIFTGTPAALLPGFTITPDGGTALFDAVGGVVSEHRAEIKALPVEERPQIVQLVISTDGEENSSRIYTGPHRDEVKEMVAKVTREPIPDEDPRLKIHKRGWVAAYLGTGDLSDAESIGVASASALAYAAYEGGTTPASFSAASAYLSRSAGGDRKGFTEDERTSTRAV